MTILGTWWFRQQMRLYPTLLGCAGYLVLWAVLAAVVGAVVGLLGNWLWPCL